MVGLGLGFRLGLGYDLDTVVMGKGKVGIIFMVEIRFSAETKVGLVRGLIWDEGLGLRFGWVRVTLGFRVGGCG